MTEWPQVGSEVLIERSQHSGSTFSKATVARLTKRDIVLDNGERFNREWLTKRTTTWGPSLSLRNPDDVRDRYLDYRRSAIRGTAATKVDALIKEWRKTGDVATAEQAIELLQRALLDQAGLS